MEGQTQIHPCEFCSEPAVREHEVTPAKTEHRDGVKVVVEKPVKAWVCAAHGQAIDAGRGWQEQQARDRKECRDELQRRQAEATLFDPGPPIRRPMA